MPRSYSRFAPYSTQCRSQLQYIDIGSHRAFDKWKEEYVIDSKHSRHEDLPSSQLPKLEAQIIPDQKQLFAVVDTCSLIRNHQEFVNFVTQLRQSYRGLPSPLRFVIPIEVVEELDRCNRPSKKRKSTQQQNNRENDCKLFGSVNSLGRNHDYPPVNDILERREPPRSFMRVIEEELRVFQIILPDFDPGHTMQLPIGNLRRGTDGDNSILGSCRRAQLFIESIPHHPETRVVLVTEDNLFKTKATSFGLPSFRWKEFMAKYRNFGKKNCIETPIIPAKNRLSAIRVSTAATSQPSQPFVPKLNLSQEQVSHLKPLPPFSINQEPKDDIKQMDLVEEVKPAVLEGHFKNLTLGKILTTRWELPSSKSTLRPTSMRIRRGFCETSSRIVGSLLRKSSNSSGQNDVCIIKELISVE